MLLLQSELKNFTLRARDGEIGRCRDFLFDDHQWTLRYMEANTGKWLLGKRVVISPIVMGEPDLDAHEIPVDLDKQQIEDAPDAGEHEPISRQFEREYYGYFGFPYYWVGGDLWGLHGYPADLLNSEQDPGREESRNENRRSEAHLRSMHEVIGYAIHAHDGRIGHATDFVLDSETWAVRYLVLDVRRWFPGPHVLLAPQWIERMSWRDKDVYVDISRDLIASAPRFEPPLTREAELAIFSHFSRPPYWQDRWGSTRSRASERPRPQQRP